MVKPALTIDDFLKAENLDALRKTYAGRGQAFWMFSTFYKQALNDWFELSKQGIIDAPAGRPEKMPATKVEKNGIVYYIYGIAHLPGLINSGEFHARTTICEDGVGNDEYMDNYNFRDHYAFPLEVAVEVLSRFMFFPSLIGLMHTNARALAAERRPFEAMNTGDMALHIMTEYPGSLMKCLAWGKAAKLPVKLSVEYYEKHASAFWHNIKYGRSKFMAEFMRQFAQRKNVKEIHVIVGAVHEPQIAYCLENDITSAYIQKLASHYLEQELKSRGEI